MESATILIGLVILAILADEMFYRIMTFFGFYKEKKSGDECEWCGEKTKSKIEYVNPDIGRYNICGDCLNLAGNQEWDKLIDRLKKKEVKE